MLSLTPTRLVNKEKAMRPIRVLAAEELGLVGAGF